MLSLDFLQDTATKQQTTLENVIREYVQLVFLSFFYQLGGSERFFFKGGTALRLVHRSPRFSEDLDFSAPSLADCSDYENLLGEVLISLVGEGFRVKISESKTTSGGCISIVELGIKDMTTSLRIDVSLRRKDNLQSQTVLVESDLYPPFTLRVLAGEALAREKLAALFDRQSLRDFYDVYFLIRKRLGHQIIAQDAERVLSLLADKKPVFFEELRPFLPRSHQRLLGDFKEILSAELKRA